MRAPDDPALLYQCPKCGARVGKRCVSVPAIESYKIRTVRTHAARRHLFGETLAAYIRGEWR
jgi:hypothetical protein